MKRKIIIGLVGIAISSPLALPIHAEDMNIEFSKDTTYTLSIPKTITLSPTSSTQAADIGVSAINTAPDQKVQISIQNGITANKVILTRTGDSTTKVSSEITGKDNIALSDGSIIAEFQDTSTKPITDGTGILNFSAITSNEKDIVKAGNYTGTLTFQAAVTKR